MDQPKLVVVSPETTEETRRREINEAEDTQQSTKTPGSGRKKQFRWCGSKDLALAKEVEKELPFIGEKKSLIQRWKNVADAMNAAYPDAHLDYLNVRRHFEIMLGCFRKNDTARRNRSGVEEEYNELDQKLAGLSELIEAAESEMKEATAVRQKKTDENKAIGEEIRDAALTTVTKRKAEENELPAPAKRCNDATLIALFETKAKDDKEMKKLEIDLKNNQLALDKEKFEHQKQKEDNEFQLQKARFEMEKEERSTQLSTQKLILELLLKKAA